MLVSLYFCSFFFKKNLTSLLLDEKLQRVIRTQSGERYNTFKFPFICRQGQTFFSIRDEVSTWEVHSSPLDGHINHIHHRASLHTATEDSYVLFVLSLL